MDLNQFAAEIKAAREKNSLLEPPSHRSPVFSIEDGYAVGRHVHEQRVGSGARPVGMKLGFTNRAAWEAVGLTNPFWSPIYDDTVTNGREVRLDNLVAPRIQPEIVLGFGSDLTRDASTEEICHAISWVAPGFEIVQCHYPDWSMAPPMPSLMEDCMGSSSSVIARRHQSAVMT